MTAPSDNSHAMQLRLAALERHVGELERRIREDERVMCALSSWIQHGFGTLLKHLADPNKTDREMTSDQIQRAYHYIFHKLKQEFRGGAPMMMSAEGFDQMYAQYEETSNRWSSIHEFQHAPDDNGYSLVSAAADMMSRLGPGAIPFENNWERQFRQMSMDVVFEAQRRSARRDGPASPDSDTHR